MSVPTLQRTAGYAKMAWQARKLKLASEADQQAKARSRLVQDMARLHGLPQKLGQMLSVSRRSEDDDKANESALDGFRSLQENGEALPWEELVPVLHAAWEKDPGQVLLEVDPKGLAASLGQVHRATLSDGRRVAVKVQYPRIRQAVRQDFNGLSWLSLPFGGLAKGFDLQGYRDTLRQGVDDELDYRQEAAHQHAYHVWAGDEPWLIVPRVVDKLTTEQVLVTEWEEGARLEDVRQSWTLSQRKELARHFLRFFFGGLFLRKMLHADWHPGNFRFRRHGQDVCIVAYDFGCVHTLEEEKLLALGRMIRATIHGDESPWPLFMALGFNEELLAPMAGKLPALLRLLWEPLFEDRPYDLAKWNLKDRVADVLGPDRWNFRFAGPPDLIYLLRAFHGLVFFMEKLDAPVSWRSEAEKCLEASGCQWDRLRLSSASPPGCEFHGMARRLKIRVKDQGRTKVELTMRASQVESLADLLPEGLSERLAKRNIHVQTLISEVRKNGYQAGPIFELDEGDRRVELWLE